MSDLALPLEVMHDLTPAQLRQGQSDVARANGIEAFFRDHLSGGGAGPELSVIPPGRCLLGAPQPSRHFGDLPRREVAFDRAFAIGRHTVTADEFEAFARATDFYWRSDLIRAEGRQPVMNISQGQTGLYLDWLSAQSGARYRLPTENEWDYAARAGSPGDYCFGDRLTCGDANIQTFQATGAAVRGWKRFLPFCAPMNRAVEVATYPANIWGLYEVHGNVWELTSDIWHGPLSPRPEDPQNRSDAWIVVKGGSWFEGLAYARAAARQPRLRNEIDVNLGFRVVRELDPPAHP
ncbi:MAG: formylglycine-generating enzyme family protein [Hydrogenophilales bacterium]|nr:formylglycine-generating enzyme family protein [Hydrogenophilales bacterium]